MFAARSTSMRARRLPASIVLITGLWGALLLGASVLWPATYGYDEPQHIDMAYAYSVHPFHFYGPGQRLPSKAIQAIQGAEPGYPPRKSLAEVYIPPRSQRASLAELGGPSPVASGQPNQMVQHPPLYYWLDAIVLRVPGVSGLAFDVQIWLMRLVSVLVMLPVPALCWASTARLLDARKSIADPEPAAPVAAGAAVAAAAPVAAVAAAAPLAPADALADPVQPSEAGVAVPAATGSGARPSRWWSVPATLNARLALLAALVPLTMPNLIRDGSSVTNDALLISATSFMLYALTRVVTGDLSKRTATITAISLVVALLTKGFALAFPPVILIAYLIGWRFRRPVAAAERPGRQPWRTLIAPLAICTAGGILGGLWWLRNLIDYHAVQVAGFGPGYDQVLFGPPDNRGKFSSFIGGFLTGFGQRIWGGIALADKPAESNLLVWGWLLLAVVGMAAALFTRGRHRGEYWLLALLPLLTLFVVMEGSLSTYYRWSDTVRANQGRYIYHCVVAIAALATIGWLRVIRPEFHRRLFTTVLLGALLSNLHAWYLILGSWYAPRGGGLNAMVDSLHSLARWSPLPMPVTGFFVVVLPVVFGVLAVLGTMRDSRELGAVAPLDDRIELTEVGYGSTTADAATQRLSP